MVHEQRSGRKGTGIAVDSSGGPAIDPTRNVLDLTKAANQRQDDLREAEQRYNEAQNIAERRFNKAQAQHVKETSGLHARFSAEIRKLERDNQAALRVAESARLDAILAANREDVSKTAAQVLNAVQTLATTGKTTEETLRNQVASTALAAENRQAAFATDMNKRLSAVELSLSEGKGKQLVTDPQMEKIVSLVEGLASRGEQITGKTAGINWVAAVVVGVVGLMVGMITIGSFLFAVLKP